MPGIAGKNLKIVFIISNYEKNDYIIGLYAFPKIGNLYRKNKIPGFLEYDWIYAMEESGCATAEEGWQPVYIGVYEQLPESSLKSMETPPPLGALMAVCPLYVKYNSMGEFIFDHSWADYAQRVLVHLFVLKDNLLLSILILILEFSWLKTLCSPCMSM